MVPPEFKPEPDWREVDLPFEIASGRSMFVETERGPTLRMRFFERISDGALVGKVWFGDASFGPPGFAHGGVVAYVLDEAMGSCGWLRRYPCVAANLNLDYLRMTPLRVDCFIESKVVRVEPKKLHVEAALTLDGKVLVTGKGLFVRLAKEKLLKVFAQEHIENAPDLSGYEFGG